MRGSNCHTNTLVTEQKTTKEDIPKYRSITTGGRVITGGIAKDIQMLLVPVVLPSVVLSNHS